MDLEIEGFSATQRTIIGPAMRAVEINSSNRQGNEGDKPQAMSTRRTLAHYATIVISGIDSVV